jgi:acyl-CoA thioester hydrolase
VACGYDAAHVQKSSEATGERRGATRSGAQVRSAEIDELGHVNNLRYIEWMLAAAATTRARSAGRAARYEALGGAWVVRSHAIEYLRPAFAGDEVVVRTWVSEMGKVSSRRKYAIVGADGAGCWRAPRPCGCSSAAGGDRHTLDRVPAQLRERSRWWRRRCRERRLLG